MNDDRDPYLESMFAQRKLDIVEGQFTNDVMRLVERRRRNVIAGRVLFIALIVVFEALLSAPLGDSLGAITQTLGMAIVPLQGGWTELLFGPLNSIAGILGVLLIGMQFLYRRLVR